MKIINYLALAIALTTTVYAQQSNENSTTFLGPKAPKIKKNSLSDDLMIPDFDINPDFMRDEDQDDFSIDLDPRDLEDYYGARYLFGRNGYNVYGSIDYRSFYDSVPTKNDKFRQQVLVGLVFNGDGYFDVIGSVAYDSDEHRVELRELFATKDFENFTLQGGRLPLTGLDFTSGQLDFEKWVDGIGFYTDEALGMDSVHGRGGVYKDYHYAELVLSKEVFDKVLIDVGVEYINDTETRNDNAYFKTIASTKVLDAVETSVGILMNDEGRGSYTLGVGYNGFYSQFNYMDSGFGVRNDLMDFPGRSVSLGYSYRFEKGFLENSTFFTEVSVDPWDMDRYSLFIGLRL